MIASVKRIARSLHDVHVMVLGITVQQVLVKLPSSVAQLYELCSNDSVVKHPLVNT